MATAVGATLRSWQDYEAGKRNPGSRIISALVRLGVNANWVLNGIGDPFIPTSLRTPARQAEKHLTNGKQSEIREPSTKYSPLQPYADMLSSIDIVIKDMEKTMGRTIPVTLRAILWRLLVEGDLTSHGAHMISEGISAAQKPLKMTFIDKSSD